MVWGIIKNTRDLAHKVSAYMKTRIPVSIAYAPALKQLETLFKKISIKFILRKTI